MGGGPVKENLLIVMHSGRDEGVINAIKKKFPYVDVTFFEVKELFGRDEGVKKELKGYFKEATILATLGHFPEKVEDAPNLKLVQLFSAGVNQLLSSPIYTSTEISITTASGIHGPPISEWTLSAVLSFSKNIPLTLKNQRSHHWGTHGEYGTQTDWVGKKVGIAGYGSIGRQVARVFTAMGSEVVAYTASPRTTGESRRDDGFIVPGTGDREGEYPVAWFSGTDKESLGTFLSAGLDCLVVSLPLTDMTRGLLGRREFELLKSGNEGKGCFLVNISRGPILRQGELVECLNDGTLSGAALDVTDPEPLPEGDALWDAKNVLISPHVSGLGKEYMGRAYDVLMVNLGRLEKGEALVNEVRRKRGY